MVSKKNLLDWLKQRRKMGFKPNLKANNQPDRAIKRCPAGDRHRSTFK
jgi:hypothetical protein